MNTDFLGCITRNMDKIVTPSFVFDLDEFNKRVKLVKESFSDIPVTYSIKANPFLVPYIPDEISYLEVCSPGELEICIANNISPDRIIYSGVNKAEEDLRRAMGYGVSIVTAESPLQFDIENQLARELNISQKVILRLSSGNQFGMSEDDFEKIIANIDRFLAVKIYGMHYFSGTQKTIKSITKDIDRIRAFLNKLKRDYDYEPDFLELGTGLKTDYYNGEGSEEDRRILDEVSVLIHELASQIPLGLEFGRFLAASCGSYFTKVCDIKQVEDGNYVICDGGINQLVYYGQNMAMKVPPIKVVGKQADISTIKCKTEETSGEIDDYCLCGSLCTVADVLVRKVTLPKLSLGDVIMFGKCGAYSVTEGTALFLSRQLPAVYIVNDGKVKQVRGITDTFGINCETHF